MSGRALPVVYDYDFDEEAEGFGEPQETPPPPPLSLGEKLTLAIAALGALSVVLQVAGAGYAGTWVGVLSGWPLAGAGLAAYFVVTYKDTTPGIKNDNVWFKGVSHRGASAWVLAAAMLLAVVAVVIVPFQDDRSLAFQLGLPMAAVLLGAFAFLKSTGRWEGRINLRSAGAWVLGVLFTGFYVALYWKASHLEAAIRPLDPLAEALTRKPADQWFLYGFLYSIAVLVFGVRTIMKYRHNRYQIVRTISVTVFQLGFAFLLPQLLKGFRHPEFYPTYFWPLKQTALFPDSFMSLWNTEGGVGAFMAGWGLLMTFVATPVLTYFFGKRWYCSWVCGCGGLAETAGDSFRQLSDNSTTAWRIERWVIHSVLLVIIAGTALLWGARMGWLPASTQGFTDGFAQWYGFFIGSLFAGVIGVGFYPLLGSRVWCRFGCPMAAVLGIFQRFFSRFRITTNGDQCMSCGNCSTYCEMGIDVRAYAEKGENIVRASCVGCGVCAAVCPRGVLKLENGPMGDRYAGADNPVKAFLNDLTKGPTVP